MRYCPFFVIDNAVSRVSPPFVCFADTSPNKVRGGKSALCYNYAKKGFTCYAFFVAANFAFKTLRKRKVQLCAVAAPLHKNLFSENIFVRNMVILICAGALFRKSERRALFCCECAPRGKPNTKPQATVGFFSISRSFSASVRGKTCEPIRVNRAFSSKIPPCTTARRRRSARANPRR